MELPPPKYPQADFETQCSLMIRHGFETLLSPQCPSGGDPKTFENAFFEEFQEKEQEDDVPELSVFDDALSVLFVLWEYKGIATIVTAIVLIYKKETWSMYACSFSLPNTYST